MKKTIAWIIILLALVVVVWVLNLIPKPEATPIIYNGETVTYVENNNEFTVTYNQEGDKVRLNFEGQQYDLNVAVSGSGARYTNTDESVVFWQHQGKAVVEIDGLIVAREAMILGEGSAELKDHDSIIGMTTTEAKLYAETKDIDYRVAFRDGSALPVTADFRPGRISVEVENNIIVGYTTE